jgi:hypothetical protein
MYQELDEAEWQDWHKVIIGCIATDFHVPLAVENKMEWTSRVLTWTYSTGVSRKLL